MPDLIGNGMEWLSEQRRKHLAVDVYYCRGSSAVQLRATRGRSRFEVMGADGVSVSIETDDFIINVVDLEIDGQPVTPEASDFIVVGELDNGLQYHVRARPGLPTHRYTDQFRNSFRVFTMCTGTHPAS